MASALAVQKAQAWSERDLVSVPLLMACPSEMGTTEIGRRAAASARRHPRHASARYGSKISFRRGLSRESEVRIGMPGRMGLSP